MNLFKSPARAVLAVLGILAIVCMFLLAPTSHIAHAGTLCAEAGLLTVDPAAQAKVIAGVESLQGEMTAFKTQTQKILDDYGRTDKEVKKAAEDVQKLMTASNDQAAQLISLKKLQAAVLKNARSSFRNPVEKALANDGVREYFRAVGEAVRCRISGKRLDPAIETILFPVKTEKSLTGVDAGLGQATVPQETFNEIYDTLLEYGQWSTLGVQRVGMRTVILPVATSRPTAVWIGSGSGVGEASTIAAGAFGGSSVTMVIQTLAAYLTVSRELLADSTVDLAPYILTGLTQSVAFGLDTAAFVGTGAADQVSAGYYGIFNAASVNVNSAATTAQGNTTVGATQLTDWLNVPLTVNPEVLRRNPKWWMHPQMMVRALGVTDKNGRPLFQSWVERPDVPGFMSILGYPVVLTGAAPNVDGNGQLVAAFGDAEGQAIGIREDLELATSDDINFPQNMRAFRALLRAGIKLKTTTGSTTLIPLAVLTLSNN